MLNILFVVVSHLHLHLFLCFGLPWVFIAMCGLASLCVENGGYFVVAVLQLLAAVASLTA